MDTRTVQAGNGGPQTTTITPVPALPKPTWRSINLSLRKRVKVSELAEFTRELAASVGAGISLVESLQGVAQEMRRGPLQEQVCDVAQEIHQGSTFSQALARHPKTFDKLYCSMIQAGETAGALDKILARVATFMEKREAIKRKIRGAMAYPGVVMVVACIIVIIIMTYVVPSFVAMFKDLGGELPLPTTILLRVSDTITRFWYLIPAVPFTLVFAARLLLRSERGRYAFDAAKLKFPLVGGLVTKGVTAHLTRTLATLLSSGVEILDALKIVQGVVANAVVHQAIGEVCASIREGASIAEPIRVTGVFPPLLARFIATGEKSGKLEEMLTRVADKYEGEVDTAVDSVKSIIDPILIVGLGVVIGAIVIALFLPLVGIIKMIH